MLGYGYGTLILANGINGGINVLNLSTTLENPITGRRPRRFPYVINAKTFLCCTTFLMTFI